MLPDQLWDMSWDEYRRYAQGYVVRQNREWERTRLICTQILNMLAEKPVSPQQYMWLSTDQEPEPASQGETEEEFWARMQQNNFFQKPTPVTPGQEG